MAGAITPLMRLIGELLTDKAGIVLAQPLLFMALLETASAR